MTLTNLEDVMELFTDQGREEDEEEEGEEEEDEETLGKVSDGRGERAGANEKHIR